MSKIAILGTRGVPANYGGFETLAEQISPKLASCGHDVTVYCDDAISKPPFYKDVKLEYSRYTKRKNPLLFYFDSIWNASKSNEILLIAGTGGAFFYLIPKMHNVRIMTNVDGLESKRAKWSLFKKLFIKLTEIAAVKLSDVVIADSYEIKRYIMDNYHLSEEKICQIEYGADINDKINVQVLDKYDLLHNSYYLVVSRIEPENNISMIIEGYLRSTTKKPLIIVGNCERTKYADSVTRYRSDKVIFIGGIYDKEELMALRRSCFAYIHGHSVGGTNPSLLEAMASRNICICHDNKFNREVTDSQMYYFSDQSNLAALIAEIESVDENVLEVKRQFAQHRIISYYNWAKITEQYNIVMKRHTDNI